MRTTSIVRAFCLLASLLAVGAFAQGSAVLTGNVHAKNDKGETVNTPSLKVLLTEGKEGFDSTKVQDGKFFG